MRLACLLLAHGLGIPGLFRLANRERVLILMYHGVHADGQTLPDDIQGKHVSAQRFAAQMEWLTQYYSVLPLGDVAAALAGERPLPRHTAVVTFDDAYRGVYVHALPVIRRLGIPATMFVPTGHIGEASLLWADALDCAIRRADRGTLEVELPAGTRSLLLARTSDRRAARAEIGEWCRRLADGERRRLVDRVLAQAGIDPDGLFGATEGWEPMTWNQVGEMAAEGIEMGSHTVTHPILAKCHPDIVRREVTESRRALEAASGRRCDLFAYPSGKPGDFNQETRRAVTEAQYRVALTTVPGLNGREADPYELRRVGVSSRDDALSFAVKCSGAWAWIKGLMRRGSRRCRTGSE